MYLHTSYCTINFKIWGERLVYCKYAKAVNCIKKHIHLLGMARPTMHVDHSTIIIVGVIILFFYVDLSHVSKLQVL